jgi:hypothetical protein
MVAGAKQQSAPTSQHAAPAAQQLLLVLTFAEIGACAPVVQQVSQMSQHSRQSFAQAGQGVSQLGAVFSFRQQPPVAATGQDAFDSQDPDSDCK